MNSLQELVERASGEAKKKDLPTLKARLETLIQLMDLQTNKEPLQRVQGVESFLVIGDTQGDEKSLAQVLEKTFAVERLSKENNFHIVFLGDYIDRADNAICQFVLLELILALKESFPEQVILIRGNHECHYAHYVYPYDFSRHAKQFYGIEQGKIAEQYYWDFFGRLPYCAVLETIAGKRCFFVHAGIPNKKPLKLEEINQKSIGDPNKDMKSLGFILTWTDFGSVSKRETGLHWDEQDWMDFKNLNNLEAMFVGHVPVKKGGVCELAPGLWRVHTAKNCAYQYSNGAPGFILVESNRIMPSNRAVA